MQNSSAYRALSDSARAKFGILQVAISFVVASIYWVVLVGFSSVHVPVPVSYVNETVGAYNAALQAEGIENFAILLVGVLIAILLPILFSVIVSIRVPIKSAITPLDITVITWGLAILSGLSSPSSVGNGNGFAYLLFDSMFLVFSEPFAYKLVGLEGTSDVFSKRVFKTAKSPHEVTDLVSSESVRSVLNLRRDEELPDGIVIFKDVGRYPNRWICSVSRTRDSGSLVSLLGFVSERWALTKLDKRRFESMCGEFGGALHELSLEEDKEGTVPSEVIDYALRPTKGYKGWAETIEQGAQQTIVLIVLLLGLDVMLWYLLHFSDVEAFFIAVTVIVTQVGQITYRGRRKP